MSFIVYSIARAGRIIRISHIETGQPMPSRDAHAGLITLLWSFDTVEAASAYVEQLRAHYEIGSKESRRKSFKRPLVECVTTGKTYRNVTEAAEANGISRVALSTHLNNPHKVSHVRGLYFRKVYENADTL